ncbi:hypothetical protein [Capnocytophaga ochracea]|nr:hypothetical protein [Capnocytophaga ochracea]UEB44452.1 hypothetical protein LK419_05560 [Capnocytophaga ochracea]
MNIGIPKVTKIFAFTLCTIQYLPIGRSGLHIHFTGWFSFKFILFG